MRVDSLVRRISAGVAVVGVVALLAAVAAGGSTKPLQLAGTWSGTYGGAVSGHFTLKWTQRGSILTGTITLSQPSGTYGIGGAVDGSAIHFGAVSVGAKYTGSASNHSMSGKWTSPEGGGSWSAHKLAVKKPVKKKKA